MFQSNAELAVRDMLRDFARRRQRQTGSLEVESEDFMDDGTPIRLRVQIDEEEVSRKNPAKIILVADQLKNPGHKSAADLDFSRRQIVS